MLFDTYAWVELLLATEKGSRVAELMKAENPSISIASIPELVSWTLRNGKDHEMILHKVKSVAVVLPLSNQIAELAGEMHYRTKQRIHDWGMVDSMIYSTALTYDLKFVTGDPHFEGMRNVIFL
ncbi:MAG: PIN domain-containing protein [Candidatus Micrarchaeota archaeon]